MELDKVVVNMWWENFYYELRNLFIVEILNRRMKTKLQEQPGCIRRFLREKFGRSDSEYLSYTLCKDIISELFSHE